MRSCIFVTAALLLRLLLLAPSPAAAQADVVLHASAVVLNPEDRSQDGIGPLRWRGGLAITSTHSRVGGLSDLVLEADGRALTAVSDAGRWLTARLSYDGAGNLDDVTAGRLGPLRDRAGAPLKGKARQDSEALTRLGDGSLLVAFERNHRLLRFAPGAAGSGLAGPSEAVAPPPGLQGLRGNAGIEALLALPDGRLLAFTEGHRMGDSYAVYLREVSGQWQSLALKPSGLFVPTGAALLPSGDVLLLERRFTLLGGLGSRLSRIPLADIRPGALLESDLIAELRAPLTRDNFEGVAVHQAPDGGTRITLVSDDNFSPLQRTLIVQFELLGAE